MYTTGLYHNGIKYEWGKFYEWKPGANTVAYYPLTSLTTTNDMKGSGTAHNLTNHGATFGVHGGVDSLMLSGTSNYLNGDLGVKISNSDYTLSIWAYRTGGIAGRDNYVYKFGNPYNGGASVLERDDNRLRWSLWYDDLDSDTYFGKNAWHNIILVFTKSGNKQTMYIDGIKRGERNAGNTHNLYNSEFNISGGGTGRGSDYWDGYLSQFIIESKSRTAQEITDYYNRSKKNYIS